MTTMQLAVMAGAWCFGVGIGFMLYAWKFTTRDIRTAVKALENLAEAVHDETTYVAANSMVRIEEETQRAQTRLEEDHNRINKVFHAADKAIEEAKAERLKLNRTITHLETLITKLEGRDEH